MKTPPEFCLGPEWQGEQILIKESTEFSIGPNGEVKCSLFCQRFGACDISNLDQPYQSNVDQNILVRCSHA